MCVELDLDGASILNSILIQEGYINLIVWFHIVVMVVQGGVGWWRPSKLRAQTPAPPSPLCETKLLN
jgi:predicted small integral membrane protein